MKSIRLGKTDSVNSVNKDNTIDVELRQFTKPLFFTSQKEIIDQYEIFKKERDNCMQYRLIATINPYCTNILYNTMTEIVKNEGDKECVYVTDNKETTIDSNKVYGKDRVKRNDMVRNTEYSRNDEGYKESLNYTYLPGLDIFNNHVIRNKTFKVVNICKNITADSRKVFNTIADYARHYDGEIIKYYNRFKTNQSDSEDPKETDKHLYEADDVYTFEESVNNNLMEENGWWGFVNRSSVLSKKYNNSEKKWNDEDFNLVINNSEPCEFIDMYPDRSLFSFNPKYNKFKHRPEYNWNICLTYPSENYYNHPLIKDFKTNLNGLMIDKFEYMTGSNGEGIIMFRTLTKHGLNGGDYINVYWRKVDDDKYNDAKKIKITDIGDLDKNNKEYYFYTTDLSLLIEFGLQETLIYEGVDGNVKKTKKEINEEYLNNEDFDLRFKHLNNDVESEYYIRLFSKLPNLLKNEEELTDVDNNDVEVIKELVDNSKPFDNELYRLGFASTIYNDSKTQITFTDGINIKNLLDNRGRPLSEIYMTIIKNNKGNDDWYKSGGTLKTVHDYEYSHCFSEVSCGFDLFFEKTDYSNERETVYKKNVLYSDVKTINKCIAFVNGCYGYSNDFGWDNLIKDKTEDEINVFNISNENTKYVGDIVEFNIVDCKEKILEDAQFRFNTYMREHGSDLYGTYLFSYEDILSDDYDPVEASGSTSFRLTEYEENAHTNYDHPEGYYYKAHYPILLKEFGDIHQDSHYDLNIKNVSVENINGMALCVIRTNLPHRLFANNLLLICDDERDRILYGKVTYVINETAFAIEGIGQLSVYNLCDILNGKYPSITFKLRKYNETIPSYAEKFPHVNCYMWRDINGVGNHYNVDLEEYPFANDYFYVYKDINFYLKRQDPFGYIGLQYEGKGYIFNDIYGNKLPSSEYEYKDENEAKC